ncbi:MAG: hypothetical protein HY704_08795 [Gemmatimonadetes bacterium]|nr:hypothetical protein [Gemmatimonadota bacterium]
MGAELAGFSVYVLAAGTPVLDGTIGAGEWSAAQQFTFTAQLNGGGTAPGTLYVMNDGSEIFVGVRFAQSALPSDLNLWVGFDPDKNGLDDGDDAVDIWLNSGGNVYFRDRYQAAGTDHLDVDDIGRDNGRAAVKNAGGYTAIELAHPFDDRDGDHDLLTAPDQTLCLNITLYLGSTMTPIAGSTAACTFQIELAATPPKPVTTTTLGPPAGLHVVGQPLSVSAAPLGIPSFFGVISTAALPIEGFIVWEGVASGVSDQICLDNFKLANVRF